jgi:glycosyltransferase involved in cell wall biosynthesis
VKVLAAIVLAPHWLVAGGPNAALSLTAALSKICDIDLARMATKDATHDRDGLKIFDLRATNPLSFVRRWVPQRVLTLLYRSRIPALIREGDYDLVHIHNPIPALEMKRVARACRSKGLPYVVSTHGIVEVSAKGSVFELGGVERVAWRWLVDAPIRWVFRHASCVMALSPADLPILEELGCRRERIVIVPNGVDLPASAPTASELEAVCRKFALPFPKPADVPVCMFLANHTKTKGLSVLLDALSGYEGPFRLVAAGSQREYLDYEGYAARSSAHQGFHFPGFVTDREAGLLLDYADLFVFPTLSDTFPLVVLEAMAHGLPVLSTRVGGIPFQVPESCGILVEPGDPKALIAALRTLTSDPDRLARMGRAAREHAASSFSWDASARSALAAYRALVSEPAVNPNR